MNNKLLFIAILAFITKTIVAQENKFFTVNGVTFEMVYVEGGTFTMGCTDDYRCDDDEKPPHSVTLDDYYIGKFEVTQGLWRAVMGYEPTKNSNSDSKWSLQYGVEDNCAAYRLTWYEAQIFITTMNQVTGLEFSLPTEAEWEYAAKGGRKSNGYVYSGSDNLDKVAHHYGNRYNSSGTKDCTVGRFMPNELGLYDMSGNVSEWCQDWFSQYDSISQTNPKGPISNSESTWEDSRRDAKVLRGASVDIIEGWNACRVTDRGASHPGQYWGCSGFRLVLHQ